MADGAGHGSSAAAAKKGRLEGKIALITGGASGLGKATAQEFIQEGASVVIADVNSALGLQTAQELGPHAHFVHCDVTVEDSVAAAVDATVTKHGRLDVMFNNAGIVGALSGTSEVASLDLGQFDRVMSVNVRGTLAGIKHAMRVMAPAGSGSILCMASISGLLGSPLTLSPRSKIFQSDGAVPRAEESREAAPAARIKIPPHIPLGKRAIGAGRSED